MKKFLNLLVLMLFIGTSSSLFGQSATGTCNSLTVSQIPNYPNNLYHIGGVSGGAECIRYTHHNNTIAAKYRLQKFNTVSQQFVNEGNLQFGANITFNNLDKGRYRVLVDVPSVVINNRCKGNKIGVYNSLSQLVGTVGDYQGALLPTNEVLVGSTENSDLFFEIGDADDFPSPAADFKELLLLDARESKHHTHYQLNVNRLANNGNNGAWWGSGWQESSDLYNTILDLEDAYGFTFWPGFNYDINLVIKNEVCNQVWVSDTQTLFICPEDSGCKENFGDVKPISIYPNPAKSSISLENFSINTASSQRVIITDMTGRTLINDALFSTNIDISNLASGIYILNVTQNDERILTEKLIVQ